MKTGDDNEIVQLHNEGKSYREIGRVIGISHVAARKRYIKALKVNADLSHVPEKDSQVSVTLENYISESDGNLKTPGTSMVNQRNQICSTKNIEQTSQESADQSKPIHCPGQRYLRKIGTSEVFAFSPYLMQRGDMVPYQGPVPVPRDFEIPELEKALLKLMNNTLTNLVTKGQ